MAFSRACMALSSIIIVGSITTSTSARGWLRDVDHAMSVAQTERRPMVLFVSMDGCVHCYRMIETTFRDTHVRQMLGTSFVAAAIKGSERPDLMEHLQIQSYPTTLLVSPDGEVVDQMVGYVDAEKFQRRLISLGRPEPTGRSVGRSPTTPDSSRVAGSSRTNRR